MAWKFYPEYTLREVIEYPHHHGGLQLILPPPSRPFDLPEAIYFMDTPWRVLVVIPVVRLLGER